MLNKTNEDLDVDISIGLETDLITGILTHQTAVHLRMQKDCKSESSVPLHC